MEKSDDHFLRPRLIDDVGAETERLISNVCPGNHLVQSQQEVDQHLLWGPIKSAYTGQATDESLRFHASSGGVISSLLNYLLESGSVDRVLHVGASESAPLENQTVISMTVENVFLGAGSRYAPSAPLEHLTDELSKPGRFALVGKPCDISAARALARHDSRVDEKIMVMLSFFCAGVPSVAGARALLSRLGIAEHDLAKFKYRGDGWPGCATATSHDGKSSDMSYANSWGDVLSKYVQFRCKICPDGTGGAADIVCADAWHSDENGYPILEEEDGRSLILTRNVKGQGILESAVANGHLATTPQPIDEIAKMQPSQVSRKRLVASRLLAMALIGVRRPVYKGFMLNRAALDAGLLANLKSFVGMLRRLLMK